MNSDTSETDPPDPLLTITTDGDIYRIDAPHLCAGIIVREGKVIETAPILSWMRDKTIAYVESYCKRKGWKIRRLTHVYE